MTVLYAYIVLKVYSFGMEICPFEVNHLPLWNGVTSVTFLCLVIYKDIHRGLSRYFVDISYQRKIYMTRKDRDIWTKPYHFHAILYKNTTAHNMLGNLRPYLYYSTNLCSLMPTYMENEMNWEPERI